MDITQSVMHRSNHYHWLTRSFEVFQDNFYHGDNQGSENNPIDYLIIGSGYGGAVAAAEITRYLELTDQQKKSVVVFERGDEFIPGKFPTSLSEVIRHLRISHPNQQAPIGNADGLYDVRVNPKVSCLLANGVGGGSLINAGVMRRPMAHVFDERWPPDLTLSALEPYFDDAEVMLGSHWRQNETSADANNASHAEVQTTKIQSDDLGHQARHFENIANTIAYQQQLPESNAHSKTWFLEEHSKNFIPGHSISFEYAATTVAYADGNNQSGVQLNKCLNCGDCATGCNHNAKNSLDTNLLVEAVRRNASIFTGATVLSLEQTKPKQNAEERIWKVHTRYTNNKLFARDPGSNDEPGIQTITAKNVLLCAGSLGSTEILMNSKAKGLSVSDKLGDQFSTNGDMIAFYATDHLSKGPLRPKSSGQLETKPDQRHIGPTIGGVINSITSTNGRTNVNKIEIKNKIQDKDKDEFENENSTPPKLAVEDVFSPDKTDSILIEEMAIPAPIREVFEQPVSAVLQLQRAFREFSSPPAKNNPKRPEKTDPDAISHTGIYAAIGDDQSAGQLVLDETDEPTRDGRILIHWPNTEGLFNLFERQTQLLNKVFKQSRQKFSRILPNPLWRLPPPLDKIEKILGIDGMGQQAALTVHPLGGCPIGGSVNQGVVDSWGRVYDTKNATSVHQGLFVLDGAIVPGGLSANPALTISALALRSMRETIAPELGVPKPAVSQSNAQTLYQCVEQATTPADDSTRQVQVSGHDEKQPSSTLSHLPLKHADATNQPEFEHRPFHRDANVAIQASSEFRLIERLTGNLKFRLNGQNTECFAELTIRSQPKNLNEIHKNSRDEPQSDDADKFFAATDWSESGYTTLLRLFESEDQYVKARTDSHMKVPRSLSSALSGDTTLVSALEKHQSDLERSISAKAFAIFQLDGSIEVLHRKRDGFFNWFFDFLSNWNWKFTKSVAGIFWVLKMLPFRPMSHALERRYLTYELFATKAAWGETHEHTHEHLAHLKREFEQPNCDSEPFILGEKKIHLKAANTIWQQLSQIDLKLFAGQKPKKKARRLTLDPRLFSTAAHPLLGVANQSDLVTSFSQLVGFLGYSGRLLAGIHWPSFLEFPNYIDTNKAKGQREPNSVSGMPAKSYFFNANSGEQISGVMPTIMENALALAESKRHPVMALTRFRDAHTNLPPVLVIHGYSTGSNTFTHPSLPHKFAEKLLDAGFDVWLLDLRTSCRFHDQALEHYSFDEVSKRDINIAIRHVYRKSNQQRVSVVAHCMGSAAFSLAVLRSGEESQVEESPFYDTPVTPLNELINAAVLSQVFPVLVGSKGNVLRSYITQNALHFWPDPRFELHPTKPATLLDRGMDIMLRTLPYSDEDRLLSNKAKEPIGPTWAIRRRLDLLYNQVFNLKNTTEKTLHHLNDLFGPVNIKTLTQAIHFVFTNQMRSEHNRSVRADNKNFEVALQQHWTFPTLCMVGDDNRVFDSAGLELFKQYSATLNLQQIDFADPIPGYGHQDLFMGSDADAKGQLDIIDYLKRKTKTPQSTTTPEPTHTPTRTPAPTPTSPQASGTTSVTRSEGSPHA